jgi:hypothetical protein
MKLRSGRIISIPVPAVKVETTYDYIIHRNGIINQIKLDLFQLTSCATLEDQLAKIDKICMSFNRDFDYLMKYKTFYTNKRFIQLIHFKTIEWIDLYPTRRDMLFKIHDMTHI